MKKILISLILGAVLAFASIDINHANVNELTKLYGIAEIKAQRIVDYIKQNGCFKKIEEIKAVKGIGEVTLSKNKDMIKIVPCKKD